MRSGRLSWCLVVNIIYAQCNRMIFPLPGAKLWKITRRPALPKASIWIGRKILDPPLEREAAFNECGSYEVASDSPACSKFRVRNSLLCALRYQQYLTQMS
jgi:hypothetical protein